MGEKDRKNELFGFQLSSVNTVEIKFIYSEKADSEKSSTLLLSTVHTDKSKGKILQNFVAFSEYMNFYFEIITSVLLH